MSTKIALLGVRLENIYAEFVFRVRSLLHLKGQTTEKKKNIISVTMLLTHASPHIATLVAA